MDQKPSFLESKVFKGILYGIGIAAVLLLAFEAGVYTGYQKAMFSSMWAQNYPENFLPRPGMHLFDPNGQSQEESQDFMNSHGAFGDIISVGPSSVVVKGRDEAEKTIIVSSKTSIERGPDLIKITDLAVGDHVIIFGTPNNSGQVEAELIRVLPPQFISFMQ